MQIQRIPGCTRVIGEEQGYKGLPLRDEIGNDPICGPGTPRMLSHWMPSAAELELLNAGGTIQLSVLGEVHPPVLIEVVDSGFNG